ncbi:MAG: hypothetical protein ACI9WU_000388, partial [Myxococcota bacterium]
QRLGCLRPSNCSVTWGVTSPVLSRSDPECLRSWSAVVTRGPTSCGRSGSLVPALALFSKGHAVLHKRDTGAVIGWVGVIALVPLLGSILYWGLGVNRVRRRAASRRGDAGSHGPRPSPHRAPSSGIPHLEALAALGDRTVGIPLTRGNRVQLLVDGDACFNAMVQAIATSKRSVGLTSYIFDADAASWWTRSARGTRIPR